MRALLDRLTATPTRMGALLAAMVCFIAAGVGMLTGVALAQDAAEPTVSEVLQQAAEVATLFQEVGWLAGLTAAIKFLVDLTKVGAIKTWIAENEIRWVRPLLAVLLGILGGLATGLARGIPIGLAIMEGVLAGIAAPGFHELMAILTSRRAREKRGADAPG